MDKTILLVDDEAIIAMHEAEVLLRHGFNVVTVYNGDKAIEAVGRERVDLILMDIDLGKGKMDGTEAAQLILQKHDIPVVFLSSHTEPEVVEKTEKITSYGYVVKNSGETVLVTSIKMAFRLYQAKQREKESERLFHDLFDNMTSGSAVYEVRGAGSKGSDYIVKNFNKASLKMEGKSLEEVVGKSLYDLRPAIDEYGLIPVLKKVWKTGDPAVFPSKIYADENFTNYYENRAFKMPGGEVVTIYNDVTDQYRLFETLKERESENKRIKDFYETILEEIHEGIWVSDKDDVMVYANAAMEKIAGIPKEKMANKNILQDFPEETVEYFRAYYVKAKKSMAPVEYQAKVGTPGGKETVQHGWLIPLLRDGVYNGMICTIQDITERQRTEQEFEDEMYKFQLLIDTLPDSVFFKDEEHRFIRVNRAKALEQGTTEGDMLGKTDFDYFPQDIARSSRADDEQVLNTGVPVIDKEEFIQSGGVGRWRLTTKLPLRGENGSIIGTMGISRDISRRREAEEELREAVREKDFLMSEVNHRMKNHLIMISSLIRLKEDALGDKVDLSDLKHRIDAFRIVYEKLEKNRDAELCDFKSYAEELLGTIFPQDNEGSVELTIHSDDAFLKMKTAVTLGLIINEAATNAIKHGFVPGEKAAFGVGMKKDLENEQFIFSLTNKGRPFPREIDINNPKTMGLRLMSELSAQLGGAVSFKREPFPVFTITFPAV